MGVDDYLGSAESTRGFFRKPEQDAAVASPLEIAPDGDEAETGLFLADKVDAHHAYDFVVAQEYVRTVIRREFVRILLVIRLARQQGSENRIAADGVICGPFPRRSRGPEGIALENCGHCGVVILAVIASLGHQA
jgi:hypothetical protein